MPGYNGFQVIEKIKRFVEHTNRDKSVKVLEPIFILHTAFASDNLRRQVEHLKIAGVYEKPLRVESLQKLVNQAGALLE